MDRVNARVTLKTLDLRNRARSLESSMTMHVVLTQAKGFVLIAGRLYFDIHHTNPLNGCDFIKECDVCVMP